MALHFLDAAPFDFIVKHSLRNEVLDFFTAALWKGVIEFLVLAF